MESAPLRPMVSSMDRSSIDLPPTQQDPPHTAEPWYRLVEFRHQTDLDPLSHPTKPVSKFISVVPTSASEFCMISTTTFLLYDRSRWCYDDPDTRFVKDPCPNNLEKLAFSQ